MATRADIESTYDYMDEILRLSLGEAADISGAFYDGDFTKSLEQAQAEKHVYMLQSLRFRVGHRLLDVGCGWGGFLEAVRAGGGRGVGLTLSAAQTRACRRRGHEVHLLDWRNAEPAALGEFDGVVSVGAFEHFVAEEDHLSGRQERIYHDFFGFCRRLLPPRGRMYLQTMTWGRYVPDPRTISLAARPGSDEYLLAVLRCFYPGSWLPSGSDQIRIAAEPFFEVVSANSGRLDYIETMTQWGSRLGAFRLAKLPAFARLVGWYLRDPNARRRIESLRGSYNRECFRRQVMDHQRIVLEVRR